MKRDKQILLKVNEREKEYIYKKAERYGISVNQLLRNLVMGERLPKIVNKK